ncbi:MULTISPECIES: helicase HerA-like domain-containing protein [unclassified Caulobacter]|uniref:helicase HerA-like domain-containing protein n=1 Tax=unclassified Caulobacter TaxID=2648921 RepID=UPI000D3D1691|nr:MULTISPECIES: helicase HerA-like domain-containing protein [unclassified Caulobacter]PTS83267.1 ATP-binding protein [Caulobacter sp. HMWF009]PTT09785.1 ATP-binding protein [Caulobacter sp. HMWF025]
MTLSIGEGELLIGLGEGPVTQRLDRSNRHGVVAGATGTGKTVTLQIMAQAFSDAGVPVFAADVKGDLSGIAMPGNPNEKMQARAASMDLTLTPAAPPTIFWDLFGLKGHPIRTTISEMGPLLLSRLLELNDVQEGVLTIVFHVADKDGLLLLDLKDLQAALKYVADHASEIGTLYGNVSAATVGSIQRKLLTLQTQGAENFFGEPALKLADIMRTDVAGRGYVNLLAADRLIQSPKLYSTFLLWLLSELFEELPEIGDPEKPRLVFFFDEAHLLFNDAPKPLVEKVEQVVRLIRSKGVGIYFVTQNPADIPDAVLGQLGARVQHALRAYTPADQKGLKAAAQSFRVNPGFDTAETIQALGVGEALVSTLDAKGAPCVVQKTLIRPPVSRLGPLTPEERTALIAKSPVAGLYDTAQDRDSAYEILQGRAQQAQRESDAEKAEAEAEKARAAEDRIREREEAREARESRAAPRARASSRQGMAETFAKSLLRTVASQAGREIMRGLMGGLKRRR